MAGPVGERLSVGVDVLLLMYRAEGRSSRNSFLQWVQNQLLSKESNAYFRVTRGRETQTARLHPKGAIVLSVLRIRVYQAWVA